MMHHCHFEDCWNLQGSWMWKACEPTQRGIVGVVLANILYQIHTGTLPPSTIKNKTKQSVNQTEKAVHFYS